jgi:hypothetical protein
MNRPRLVPVLLASAVLVGAANLGAFAATGGPLVLGQSNTAAKTTKLKTTGNGAALSLKSKKGKAPLKVSSSTKVTKLNADLVDGLEGDALQSKSYVYNLSVSGATDAYVAFALPGLPAGRYDASFAIAAGTDATGFGCFLATGTIGTDFRITVAGLGDTISGGLWFANAAGHVDTTTRPHRLICQRQGGTATTIPADPSYSATVSFTRLDDVSTSGSAGLGTALPRGVTP